MAMLAQERELDNDLMERIHAYGVRRRPNGDYSATVFRCPTHPKHREYESVRPCVDQPEMHAVCAYCYWCDTMGRVRGIDPGFDRDHTQPHYYPTLGDDDA